MNKRCTAVYGCAWEPIAASKIGGRDMFESLGRPLRAVQSSWSAVDLAALVLRGVLGFVFIDHVGQKLFRWFGGGGIHSTTVFLTAVGIPAPTCSPTRSASRSSSAVCCSS